MATIGWVNFNCWGLQPSIIAFASRNTDSSGLGSATLQWCTNLSLVTLCLGAVLPLRVKVRSTHALTAYFTALSMVIYLMAFGHFAVWNRPFGAPLLVCTTMLVRFLESYINTMVYVLISERFPSAEATEVSRITGIVDRTMVTIGVVLSIGLVSLIGHAGSKDANVHARKCYF